MADIIAARKVFRGTNKAFCQAMGLGVNTFLQVRKRWARMERAADSEFCSPGPAPQTSATRPAKPGRLRRRPVRDHEIEAVLKNLASFAGTKEEFCKIHNLLPMTLHRIKRRWRLMGKRVPAAVGAPQAFVQAATSEPAAMAAPVAPPPTASVGRGRAYDEASFEGLVRENAALKRLLAEAWRLTA